MRLSMKILVILIGCSMIGAVACHLVKAEEPKQRQEWVASPMKYGNTQFEGMPAPGAHDAGTD